MVILCQEEMVSHFNTSNVINQQVTQEEFEEIEEKISIHQMLLINFKLYKIKKKFEEFQYIKCY